MDIKNIILIFVAVFHFIMATVLIFKNRRSAVNASFALVLYGASLWSFAIAMFLNTSDMEIATGWARIYYFASGLIPLVFLVFANFYIFKLHDLDIVKILYGLLPFFVIIFVIFHPTFFIEKATHYDWGNDANIKLQGNLIYSLYFLAYLVWAYIILFKKYKSSEGVNKKNLSLVTICTLISFLFGLTFNLILPLLGNYRLIWIGPYFTLITLAYLVYIIFYRERSY